MINIQLFIFSLFFHLFILGLIQLGVFGVKLKIFLNSLLENNKILISIFSLVGFILLKLYLGFNI